MLLLIRNIGIKKFIFHNAQGIAYVEFALSIPVLLLLFLGSIEVTRYILIVQKIENIVFTVADVTAQTDPNTSPLTSSMMNAIVSAIGDMMNPYPFDKTKGVVIITDVTQGTTNPTINWQYCTDNTSLHVTSALGNTIGAIATLPAGFTMSTGEEAVIGEIFYNYVPLSTSSYSVVTATTLYRYAVYMPRLGALSSFVSNCP